MPPSISSGRVSAAHHSLRQRMLERLAVVPDAGCTASSRRASGCSVVVGRAGRRVARRERRPRRARRRSDALRYRAGNVDALLDRVTPREHAPVASLANHGADRAGDDRHAAGPVHLAPCSPDVRRETRRTPPRRAAHRDRAQVSPPSITVAWASLRRVAPSRAVELERRLAFDRFAVGKDRSRSQRPMAWSGRTPSRGSRSSRRRRHEPTRPASTITGHTIRRGAAVAPQRAQLRLDADHRVRSAAFT